MDKHEQIINNCDLLLYILLQWQGIRLNKFLEYHHYCSYLVHQYHQSFLNNCIHYGCSWCIMKCPPFIHRFASIALSFNSGIITSSHAWFNNKVHASHRINCSIVFAQHTTQPLQNLMQRSRLQVCRLQQHLSIHSFIKRSAHGMVPYIYILHIWHLLGIWWWWWYVIIPPKK